MEAIKEIDVPTKVHAIHRSVGLVNYYRDMWRKRTHTLAPLTKICLMKVNFKWTDVENNAFIAMNKIVGCDVLISYSDFSERCIIHTGDSKMQLGGDN